jgi:hypothetical protein
MRQLIEHLRGEVGKVAEPKAQAHWDAGHLKFLAVGSQNTLKTAAPRMPDAGGEINWRYVHVGFVDLVNGEIVER